MHTLRPAALLFIALFLCSIHVHAQSTERLRLIIETDAGGDPDDEQSLVRFLLYSGEWDIEGIIANRPQARDRENLNPKRTGLEIVRGLLKAYGECQPNLLKHDSRYPSLETLWQRTVAGHDNTDEAVDLIIRAVDRADARPLWYSDWGTDHGAATNNLRRALDRVLRERGTDGYAKFKRRLRLSSADAFGEHTFKIDPPFPLWVDTFRPPVEGKRWYHRFSALTATAGGFDLVRDALTGHGPLGALYPTNTTHWQKEGDTGTFLYLVPTGMNDPEHPEWGSWAGRYGLMDANTAQSYYWASPVDTWQGTTHRDQTLRRWAVHLQNDFKARLDWCVKPVSEANHPPVAAIDGPLRRTVKPGTRVTLSSKGSRDPDGGPLSFAWIFYPEPSDFKGDLAIDSADQPTASFVSPDVKMPQSIHILLTVTDHGAPPLSRYQRLIVTIDPNAPNGARE
jgi:hypothetical protein